MEKDFPSTKKSRQIYYRVGPVGPPLGTHRIKTGMLSMEFYVEKEVAHGV